MSKFIVIGGASAVILAVVFLVYRQSSRDNTETQVELNHPGLSPVETAKFEFEELMRKFFRKMIEITTEFNEATTQQQIQSVNLKAEDIQINANLELNNMSRVINEEFGIVMIPPTDADASRMSLEEVDDIEFTWGPCPTGGTFRECQIALKRARGDFD